MLYYKSKKLPNYGSFFAPLYSSKKLDAIKFDLTLTFGFNF